MSSSDVTDAAADPQHTPRRRRRRWPWVAGGALVLVAGGYVGAAAAVDSRIPVGTTVAGTDVGGLGEPEARAVLQERLGSLTQQPLAVEAGSREGELVPADAGLGFDVQATTDDLVGFSLDPRDLLRQVSGEGVVAPVEVVDDAALTAAVEDLATRVDVAPVEGAVAFTAEGYEVTDAVVGSSLELDGAADLVRDGWADALLAGTALELPAEEVVPAVGQDAVDAVVADFAEPATSAPLVVRVGDVATELPVEVVAPTLSAGASEGTLVPALDAQALRAALVEAAPELDTQAQDADVVLRGGSPTVVPAVVGRSVDAGPLGEAALPALTAPDRTAVVPASEVAPDLTTEAAQGLGISEVVAEFSTPLSGSAPGRLNNIEVGASSVDGTLLRPGDVFDLNDVLGRRTAAAGYAEASIISGGRYVESYGGGVSQISTTMYNAGFFAGMEDLEHTPHSFYISRYPEGREATLDFNSIDMRFRNDTDTGILVQMFVSGGELTARLWGTQTYDVTSSTSGRSSTTQPESRVVTSEDCIPSSASEGFTVTVTRTVSQGGSVVRTDDDTVVYDPVPGIACE